MPEPGFAVFEGKIRPPNVRPGVVTRSALVTRLRRSDATQTVLVIGPAGYGKTTLLAQWAAAETRPVAWMSVDTRDNDPFVFLRNVIAAVNRIQPLDPRLLTSPRASTKSMWASTVQRGLRAVASWDGPHLLVLDNVDLLVSQESRSLLSRLVDQMPQGSTAALGARVMPKLPISRLRSHGALKVIGVGILALSGREAQLLLRAANADLTDAATAELVESCEGWPAALYLAALACRDGTSTTPAHFAGTDRYIADYLCTEHLSHLRPRELLFLRRTSVLGALSGPLCDAVLQEEGSARELEKIARMNLFLPRLDQPRGWFRLHRLLRDLLQAELVKEEPHLIPALHRRAADWYERQGEFEAALEHADAAGDTDRVAAIISAIAFPLSCRGRTATLEQWLARFDVAGLERYPALAVHGSRVHALRGRGAAAEGWLEAAERGARRRRRDAIALRPRIAVVRAALCRQGPRQMLLDATAALRNLPRGSYWHPTALMLRGVAAMLLGADEEADSLLSDAALEASGLGWSETPMIATSQRSLIARRGGDDRRSDELSAEAREIAARGELEAYPTYAIALAASAHTSLRCGRWAEGRELLTAAGRHRPRLTEAVPWLAVGTRLELARCYVTLRDLDAARTLVAEIEAILGLRPELGTLKDRAQALEQDVRALTAVEENARLGLTPAELRLLPLLATHLSFREIAEQLEVSRNTVKTQAISIYRKLGVSGRSDAIGAAGA